MKESSEATVYYSNLPTTVAKMQKPDTASGMGGERNPARTSPPVNPHRLRMLPMVRRALATQRKQKSPNASNKGSASSLERRNNHLALQQPPGANATKVKSATAGAAIRSNKKRSQRTLRAIEEEPRTGTKSAPTRTLYDALAQLVADEEPSHAKRLYGGIKEALSWSSVEPNALAEPTMDARNPPSSERATGIVEDLRNLGIQQNSMAENPSFRDDDTVFKYIKEAQNYREVVAYVEAVEKRLLSAIKVDDTARTLPIDDDTGIPDLGMTEFVVNPGLQQQVSGIEFDSTASASLELRITKEELTEFQSDMSFTDEVVAQKSSPLVLMIEDTQSQDTGDEIDFTVENEQLHEPGLVRENRSCPSVMELPDIPAQDWISPSKLDDKNTGSPIFCEEFTIVGSSCPSTKPNLPQASAYNLAARTSEDETAGSQMTAQMKSPCHVLPCSLDLPNLSTPNVGWCENQWKSASSKREIVPVNSTGPTVSASHDTSTNTKPGHASQSSSLSDCGTHANAKQRLSRQSSLQSAASASWARVVETISLTYTHEPEDEQASTNQGHLTLRGVQSRSLDEGTGENISQKSLVKPLAKGKVKQPEARNNSSMKSGKQGSKSSIRSITSAKDAVDSVSQKGGVKSQVKQSEARNNFSMKSGKQGSKSSIQSATSAKGAGDSVSQKGGVKSQIKQSDAINNSAAMKGDKQGSKSSMKPVAPTKGTGDSVSQKGGVKSQIKQSDAINNSTAKKGGKQGSISNSESAIPMKGTGKSISQKGGVKPHVKQSDTIKPQVKQSDAIKPQVKQSDAKYPQVKQSDAINDSTAKKNGKQGSISRNESAIQMKGASESISRKSCLKPKVEQFEQVNGVAVKKGDKPGTKSRIPSVMRPQVLTVDADGNFQTPKRWRQLLGNARRRFMSASGLVSPQSRKADATGENDKAAPSAKPSKHNATSSQLGELLQPQESKEVSLEEFVRTSSSRGSRGSRGFVRTSSSRGSRGFVRTSSSRGSRRTTGSKGSKGSKGPKAPEGNDGSEETEGDSLDETWTTSDTGTFESSMAVSSLASGAQYDAFFEDEQVAAGHKFSFQLSPGSFISGLFDFVEDSTSAFVRHASDVADPLWSTIEDDEEEEEDDLIDTDSSDPGFDDTGTLETGPIVAADASGCSVTVNYRVPVVPPSRLTCAMS